MNLIFLFIKLVLLDALGYKSDLYSDLEIHLMLREQNSKLNNSITMKNKLEQLHNINTK